MSRKRPATPDGDPDRPPGDWVDETARQLRAARRVETLRGLAAALGAVTVLLVAGLLLAAAAGEREAGAAGRTAAGVALAAWAWAYLAAARADRRLRAQVARAEERYAATAAGSGR